MLVTQDGTYYATGSYETLAARLFKELNVDVFYVRAIADTPPFHFVAESLHKLTMEPTARVRQRALWRFSAAPTLSSRQVARAWRDKYESGRGIDLTLIYIY